MGLDSDVNNYSISIIETIVYYSQMKITCVFYIKELNKPVNVEYSLIELIENYREWISGSEEEIIKELLEEN